MKSSRTLKTVWWKVSKNQSQRTPSSSYEWCCWWFLSGFISLHTRERFPSETLTCESWGMKMYCSIHPQAWVLSRAMNLGVLLLTLCGEKGESQGGPEGSTQWGQRRLWQWVHSIRTLIRSMKCFWSVSWLIILHCLLFFPLTCICCSTIH